MRIVGSANPPVFPKGGKDEGGHHLFCSPASVGSSSNEITRRSFLVTAGAAVAAPIFLRGDRQSRQQVPILGEGEHKYEAIHDWGELPHNIRYGNTHGVCEDSQGHIYIHHTVNASSESTDTLVVFDQKGKFVRSWGKQFKGGAHGLAIRKEGSEEFLYLCDYQHGIVTKRTLKGEEVFTLGIRRNRMSTRRSATVPR